MRNLKKLVALIVTIVMIATFAIPAFAATPADVKGTDYEGAVTRLVSLGVVTGYPDGTFGPNDSITRAQAAAIVVRALGYESIADSAKGVTKFSDVAAKYWGAGYINLAVSLNLIKGYGNGKFGPEDKVTFDQMVTMVVRALGQEAFAEKKGGFPSGYLVQAKVIGFTDGVKGIAGTNATRGIVAQLVDNAKTSPIYEQTGFGDSQQYTKVETGKGANFLEKMGMTKVPADSIVTQTPGSVVLDANKFVAGGTTYEAVAGMFDIEALLGKKVSIWTNSDSKVVLAEAVAGTAVAIKTVDDVTVTDGVYKVDTTLADGTDKVYTVVAGSAAIKDLQVVAALKDAAQDVKGVAADLVKISAVVDGDNIQFLNAVEFTAFKKLDADPIENKVHKDIRLFAGFYVKYGDKSAKKVVIEKDGAIVDWTALKTNDVLFIAGNGTSGTIDSNYVYIKATNKTVTGKVEAAKPTLAAATSIKVGGTWYDTSAFKATIDYVSTLIGAEVTVTLDPAGKVFAIAGTAVASTDKYGVVLGNTYTPADSINDAVYKVKILTASGDKVTYTVVDNANTADVKAASGTITNRLATYTVNSDGNIDKISLAAVVTTGNTFPLDTSKLRFGTSDITSGAVIFYDGAVIKLTDLKDDEDATYSAKITTADGIVALLLTARVAAVTADNYGYVTGSTALADNVYTVDMITKDGAKSLTTTDSTYGVAGKLVKYDVDGSGKITIKDGDITGAETGLAAASGDITYADANKIKLTDSYWFTDNTLIIYDDSRDGSGAELLTKAELYTDMTATVIYDSATNDIIAVIVTAM